jgi:hypothetical protein
MLRLDCADKDARCALLEGTRGIFMDWNRKRSGPSGSHHSCGNILVIDLRALSLLLSFSRLSPFSPLLNGGSLTCVGRPSISRPITMLESNIIYLAIDSSPDHP